MDKELTISSKFKNAAFALIGILVPFPGTRLFERFKSENRLLHENWNLYNGETVCFKPKLKKNGCNSEFSNLRFDHETVFSIVFIWIESWVNVLLSNTKG